MDTRSVFSNLFASRDNNTCEVCGNHYDKCMQVRVNGELHVFDSFECAIHALAPHCAHCGCRIVGHGLETGDVYFCCAHCAEEHGIEGFQDRMLHPAERRAR
ncbi:MAG: hypothetical protein ACM3QS_03245 [Bacteroidota bacterium]